jgi:hypothetical protein
VASLALPWFAPPEILSLNVATFKGGRSSTAVWIPLPNIKAADTLSSGKPSMYRNLYFSGQVRNVEMADHEM